MRMPSGRKPGKPGTATDRNPRVHPWNPSPGSGWQHGDPEDGRRKIPSPPVGLMPESEEAWRMWFTSWWASNWSLEDLPQLQLIIRQFDKVVRGELALKELTPALDGFGITPKGRQDRRWLPPEAPKPAKPEADKVEQDEMAKRRAARQQRGVG